MIALGKQSRQSLRCHRSPGWRHWEWISSGLPQAAPSVAASVPGITFAGSVYEQMVERAVSQSHDQSKSSSMVIAGSSESVESGSTATEILARIEPSIPRSAHRRGGSYSVISVTTTRSRPRRFFRTVVQWEPPPWWWVYPGCPVRRPAAIQASCEDRLHRRRLPLPDVPNLCDGGTTGAIEFSRRSQARSSAYDGLDRVRRTGWLC